MSIQTRYDLPKKQNDIVLVGEILVDEIKDSLSGNITSILGGSTANITMNLKKLGIEPKFFGAVGNDSAGRKILTTLNECGVDSTNIYTLNKKTTIVKIDINSGSPLPLFYRSTDYHLYYSQELDSIVKNSKIFHFSFWPLSLEPSKSTILKAIDVAKANGVVIGFDPNYHIDLDISGNGVTDIIEVIKKVDIIKPSLDDSIRLFGLGFTNYEYIKKYQNLGCKLIVMTIGKDGLIASYNNELIELPSMATNVIDSTGAGDAFWGGLYAGILSNESILNSIKLGLLCSAYNLKQVGALNEFPNIKEMKKDLKI